MHLPSSRARLLGKESWALKTQEKEAKLEGGLTIFIYFKTILNYRGFFDQICRTNINTILTNVFCLCKKGNTKRFSIDLKRNQICL